jgi:hypothetical protein
MSQKTYNKAQCLKLLKVDTKTFDKWLEKANIIPIRDDYDTRQKLLTYEQVCQLADEHKRPRPPLPAEDEPEPAELTPGALYKRIDALEQSLTQRLDALQREMAGVAQRITTPQERPATPAPRASNTAPAISTSTPRTTTPPRLTRQARSKRKTKARKNLPSTLVPLATFRQLHNVSEKAVENAVGRNKLAVVRGAWLYQHRSITVALDRQGQRQFYELFYAREGFQQCDLCEHAL